MSQIIIALDVASGDEARSLVDALGDSADFYKVGLELYAVAGMDFVRELKRSNDVPGPEIYELIAEQVKPRRRASRRREWIF